MARPLILGFDTSAAHCAAALLLDGRVLAARDEPMSRGQGERLFPLLEEVLNEAGAGWTDLAAISVGIGPGNFTGIRISVAAGRGLSLALGIPAVGVSTLQAQAHGTEGVVISSAAAPRDRLYLQVIGGGATGDPGIFDPLALPVLPARAEPVCIGAGAETIALASSGRVAGPAYPLAEAIARLADLRRHATSHPPTPLYLRAPDADPPRNPAPAILDLP